MLFFIQVKTKKIVIGEITAHPNGEWMAQVTGWDGELHDAKYLIHDRDTKYTAQIDSIMSATGIKAIKLSAVSKNLNAYVERWGKVRKS